MIRLVTWPFRALWHAVVTLCTSLFAFLRGVMLWVGAASFVVAFGVMLWGLFGVVHTAPGKASMYTLEKTFRVLFGLLPLWVIVFGAILAIWLWTRHRVLGSLVAGGLAAVVVMMILL